ncbi:hypothetical protein [Roseobacter sinensis]|uniref:Antifreeze glycopeptide polyprotein n=1 Tax=Roseobacter sinensis TaxID=2931391 RepID=A0ABT3BBP4_9RHOB|nr:hypothetical protein [Roseobacter sp. WL0113]MCV3270993.1 hypothetical protein [Roseobacter sp. WL0113]
MTTAGTLGAQEAPLSVIDWVQQNPDQPAMTSVALPRGEPPVAASGVVPTVDVKPLDQEATRIIGLVPANVTGLPQDLWKASDPERLSRQLTALPDFRLPAAQALLFTALLTEAEAPGRDAEEEDLFTLARVESLRRYGALDPAQALIEQADVTRDTAHFAAYMDLALLTGEEWRACRTLSAHPALAPGLAARIFCAARQGDWATAALLFDTGRALDAMSPAQIDLLDRFLHPEAFEDAPPLRPARDITPLLFRLHEAIGEPLPTRSLPRAFAVADLRDLAGWKAQLEAAERLAETGALPDNRLLGLYSDRQPAASGGVWDRVRAIQQLDTALATGSGAAVGKTLPAAWAAMQQAGLETTFAGLFVPRLSRVPLDGRSAELAETLALLSPDYVAAAQGSDRAFLKAVAVGDPSGMAVGDEIARAIRDAFAPDAARSELLVQARSGQLGAVILETLVLLEDGAAGNTPALTQALATLRALGFDDTMRRASLQILLLERFG